MTNGGKGAKKTSILAAFFCILFAKFDKPEWKKSAHLENVTKNVDNMHKNRQKV